MSLRTIQRIVVVVSSCLFIISCASLQKESQRFYSGHEEELLAVVDVNLITMETDYIQPGQTVIIRNQYIQEIGPSEEIPIPENVQVISGEGKYMLPGFVDMHVHISDESDLPEFLRYGITTVRHMAEVPWWAKAIGFSDVLSLRDKQQKREVIGPEIHTCGFVLDGDPAVSPMNRRITTVLQAEKEIKKESKAGYDYIKIYDNLSPEAFEAILDAAERYDLPVVGHVPYRVGLEDVLQSSVVSIEHLTGYIDNNSGNFLIPEDELKEYATITGESGIYNCPTLVIWDALPSEDSVESLKNDPRFLRLPGHLRWLWKKSLPSVYDISYPDKTLYAEHMKEISKKMLLTLYNAGCPLLVGTDANFVGVYPGISALREMELFSEAGIPAIDVLKAATVTPAKALDRENEIGTIAVGKLANMVLLEANPLEDIKNVNDMAGIFERGRWMSREDIEELIAVIR